MFDENCVSDQQVLLRTILGVCLGGSPADWRRSVPCGERNGALKDPKLPGGGLVQGPMFACCGSMTYSSP
jgi:hypothetical protein